MLRIARLAFGLRENHPQIARALVTKHDFFCPLLRTTAFGVVCASCAASTANNFTHTHTNPNVVVSVPWLGSRARLRRRCGRRSLAGSLETRQTPLSHIINIYSNKCTCGVYFVCDWIRRICSCVCVCFILYARAPTYSNSLEHIFYVVGREIVR